MRAERLKLHMLLARSRVRHMHFQVPYDPPGNIVWPHTWEVLFARAPKDSPDWKYSRNSETWERRCVGGTETVVVEHGGAMFAG